MPQSLILEIDELTPAMTEAFGAVNDGYAALEQAFNAPRMVDVLGAATYTVTATEYIRNAGFHFDGLASDLTVTVPSIVGRLIAVTNASPSYKMTVGTGAGATVDLPPLAARLLHVAGDDVNVIGEGKKITGFPVIVQSFTAGTPTPGDVLLSRSLTDRVLFPADFAGSRGSVVSNPASTVDINVSVNGMSVGTIEISTLGAFTFDSPALALNAGDTLTLTLTSNSAEGISLTLKGKLR